jgi:hypothetical protein
VAAGSAVVGIGRGVAAAALGAGVGRRIGQGVGRRVGPRLGDARLLALEGVRRRFDEDVRAGCVGGGLVQRRIRGARVQPGVVGRGAAWPLAHRSDRRVFLALGRRIGADDGIAAEERAHDGEERDGEDDLSQEARDPH